MDHNVRIIAIPLKAGGKSNRRHALINRVLADLARSRPESKKQLREKGKTA
jgi:hypothetical protein